MTYDKQSEDETPAPNVHDGAETTAHLRAEHRSATTRPQLTVDRLTAVVGRPAFIAALIAVIVVWVLANLAALAMGRQPPDPPPFALLQAAASVAALLIAALILTTQRAEDQHASHRSLLILELSILNDQKISKIIALLEEGRRDNPALRNRADDEALAMSTPSDPQAVLGAIKEVENALD